MDSKNLLYSGHYFRLCRSEDNILCFQENVILHSDTNGKRRRLSFSLAFVSSFSLGLISKGGHTGGGGGGLGGGEGMRWGTDNFGFPYCPQIFRFSYYRRSQVFQTGSVNWWFPISIATVPWLFRKIKKLCFFSTPPAQKNLWSKKLFRKTTRKSYFWNNSFTRWKRIQDSLGFWIPHRGFQIPGTGFQSLSVELGFVVPIFAGIPDSLSCIPDSKAQNSGFLKHNFLGSGIRIPLHDANSFCS